MNALGPESEFADKPRTAPMKFLYSTGSKPLDGYTIKRGVGRGGFGEVYFATSDAGKEVALKLIRRNLDIELRGVRHCLNLKHPNLISLFDIRSDESEDEWVIMEYVSGDSLEAAIDRNPNGMTEEEVLYWMRGITAGVSYLHDNGIVHRDLKPGNIFMDGSVPSSNSGVVTGGTVKIGDYGLSKFISCSRRSGQTESVGTVHYMAPEIANGRYGQEIDTYALGIILYEMLTGHVPFEGESIGEVLMKHLTAEPDLERVDEPYREIIRRALAKDPESRLRSVAELQSMLPGASPGAQFGTEQTGAERINSGPQAAGAAQGQQDYFTPKDPSLFPEPSEGEPLYNAVADGVRHIWQRYYSDNPHPMARFAVALGVLALVMSFPFWLGFLIPVLVCYGFYYFFWCAFLEPPRKRKRQQDPSPGGARPKNVAANSLVSVSNGDDQTQRKARHKQAAQQRRPRVNWKHQAEKELCGRPLLQQVAEVSGSMLLAAVLCSIGSTLMATTIGEAGGNFASIALWLSIITTLGAWTILVSNRFTEGRVEDQTPKRGMLLLGGVMVGVVAFALSQTLMVGLPANYDFGPNSDDTLFGELFDYPHERDMQLFGGGVTPNLGISVAYFGFLFLALRWWRQAEFTRVRRFSIWPVAGAVLIAWLVHLVWWYPQPIGMAFAGIVAIATQLSSPWLPPSKRAEYARAPQSAV